LQVETQFEGHTSAMCAYYDYLAKRNSLFHVYSLLGKF
jgi:hypothetical protein